jgi:hypothetical protein
MNEAMYSYVVHELLGCSCGCCGHRAYLCDEQGIFIESTEIEFQHPYGEDHDEWAKSFCLFIWPNIPVRLEMCDVSED